MKINPLLLLFLFSILNFIFPPQIYADQSFTSSATVDYTITDQALTHVTFHIVLTNKTSEYYASKYKISIGYTDIQNLAATDDLGSIHPKLTKTDSNSAVEVTFNKKAAGIGKSLLFTISFDTKETAKKSGNILEVDIPGISQTNDFSTFNVYLHVPSSYSKASYVKPNVGGNSLNFTKNQIGTSGISIGFGDKQTYDFNLLYHISNQNVFPVKTEIALPPNTNYQDIHMQSIVPKPENVMIDTDGNWMAQYTLKPTQKLTIQAKGQAILHLTPKTEHLSQTEQQVYLKPQTYWEQTEIIKTLGRRLKTPEAIYSYVSQTLHYDYDRVTEDSNRFGAAAILTRPTKAVCLEYTDLFIAIARSAGIPAREVDGYGYTQNSKERPISLVKDILHAWPEYYDRNQQKWIMIDPTWASTTNGTDYFHQLDFDHFAFTIRGTDSNYPIPAGGYKFVSDIDKKDVTVLITSEVKNSVKSQTVQTNIPSESMTGLPIEGTISVKNTGSVAIPAQQFSVITSVLHVSTPVIEVPLLPPFGSSIIPVTFDKFPLLSDTYGTVTIRGQGINTTSRIHVTLLDTSILLTLGGVFFATIFCFAIFIITKRTRRISFPQQSE